MDQRNRLLWACALAACVAVSGCRKKEYQGGGADGPVTGGLTDPEIAAVMRAVNDAEIQQGNLAVTRALSPDVRSFAQQIVKDHTTTNERQAMLFSQRGITPMENSLSMQLTKEAMDALTMLREVMDQGGADGGTAADMGGGTGGDLGVVDLGGGDIGVVDLGGGDIGVVDLGGGDIGVVDLGDGGTAVGSGLGSAFDRAYINVQVRMHTRVLGIIDSSLLPNLKDTALQMELQAVRQMESYHLTMAKALQSRLGP